MPARDGANEDLRVAHGPGEKGGGGGGVHKLGENKDPNSEAQPGDPGLAAENTAHLNEELERPMVDDMGETDSVTHPKGSAP